MTDFSTASARIQRLDEASKEFRDALRAGDHDLARGLAKEIKLVLAWLDDFYDGVLIQD